MLLGPVLELMAPRAGGIYVDGTLGGGGYTLGMLRQAPGITVVGIDRDPSALAASAERLGPALEETGGRLLTVHGAFGELGEHLDELGIEAIDGLVLDLGVSSPQLDVAERGFSFMRDGPLDMRMDPTGGATAAALIAGASEAELARIFRDYGEERFARPIARALIRARERAPITGTAQLAALVERAAPQRGPRRIHPATRVFQALRIAVNGELDQLEAVLPAAVERLRPGGRLAVVSFHSLEDRIVKRFIQGAADPCVCPPDLPVCACGRVATLVKVTRRAVEAGDDEIQANPRARSARLRVAERI